MSITRQIIGSINRVNKCNIRNCHHDHKVQLQEYHIIGLHNNLTRLVNEITNLNKKVDILQHKIDNLESIVTKTCIQIPREKVKNGETYRRCN